MTQEEFEKAIELKKRLDSLSEVKEELKNTVRCRLSYVKWNEYRYPSWELCDTYTLKAINEILNRHDTEIREEIEAEIEKIMNEIREL